MHAPDDITVPQPDPWPSFARGSLKNWPVFMPYYSNGNRAYAAETTLQAHAARSKQVRLGLAVRFRGVVPERLLSMLERRHIRKNSQIPVA